MCQPRLLFVVFQSTLPQGERLLPSFNAIAFPLISIHAPTRGATQLGRGRIQYQKISIHAPTRGATKKTLDGLLDDRNFNPRSHKGSDHAYRSLAQSHHYFNPRSHKGSDVRVIISRNSKSKFQSTLPQGERQKPVQ